MRTQNSRSSFLVTRMARVESYDMMQETMGHCVMTCWCLIRFSNWER